MASKVTIFNKALYKLKKNRIVNPSQSVELSDIYEAERDIVLAAHPWNFAKFWATVAADATNSNWRYAYTYSLPADPWCLRVWEMEFDIKWEVGGNRKIHTDQGAPLRFSYIGRVTDESRFSPGFVDTLATKLAIEAGPKIAGISAARLQVLQQEYDAKLSSARSDDGQEGNFLMVEASDYLDARY